MFLEVYTKYVGQWMELKKTIVCLFHLLSVFTFSISESDAQNAEIVKI